MDTRFEFEKVRDFGTIIGDALMFFARNFKSLLLGFLLYIGPFILIGILAIASMSSELGALMLEDPEDFNIPTGLLYLMPVSILASVMVFVLTCAAIRKYREKDEPIAIHLWPCVAQSLVPGFVAALIGACLLLLPALVLCGLGYLVGQIGGLVGGMFLAIPVILYLVVPVMIFMVLHILERGPVFTSLSRAFRLVRGKWLITFVIYLVVGLLAGIASSILTIPAYILFLIQLFGAATTGEAGEPVAIWMGIFYALSLLGSLFASIYQVLGIILQYFSLREQKEGHGLMRRIESLDETHDLNLV